MGSILGKDIIKRASTLLRDTQGRRWKPEELLDWLNDGQREIGILKPDTCTVMMNITMVAGAEQTVPANVIRLFAITHNMGDGNAVGAPIRLIDQDELDALDPAWRTGSADNTVIHYTFDGRAPKTWNCYPPQSTGGLLVRAMVQVSPTDVEVDGLYEAANDTAIFLDDVYQTALLEYVLARAYDKNDEQRDEARSNMFYNRFLQRLGMRATAEVKNGPNRNAPPAQQSRQAGGVSQRARAD